MPILHIFFVLTLTILVLSQSSPLYFEHNVLDYGAIGDGLADDTLALSKAWEATCKSPSSYSSMVVPANKTFLVHPLTFQGPCNSTNVEINGNITVPSEPSQWKCEDNICRKWLSFNGVNGLSLHGFGTIDGQGEKWWLNPDQRRPSALVLENSTNVHISGLSLKNSPNFHLVLFGSKDVYISHIAINAPETSPNTDGINIRQCTNVFINHGQIATGDDCVSIVGGSSYVNVNDITCGPGHGISIGSLGHNGGYEVVEYVNVSNVVFKRSTNGVRIKTWQGGRGFARHFIFENIINEAADNPIVIDQYYFSHGIIIPNAPAVQIYNVTYSNINGTSMKETTVKLACSGTIPCTDIFMKDIYIVMWNGKHEPAYCENVHGIARGEMVPSVPCLQYD